MTVSRRDLLVGAGATLAAASVPGVPRVLVALADTASDGTVAHVSQYGECYVFNVSEHLRVGDLFAFFEGTPHEQLHRVVAKPTDRIAIVDMTGENRWE